MCTKYSLDNYFNRNLYKSGALIKIVTKDQQKLQIHIFFVFVLFFRSEPSFSKYRASMPWLSLHWHECILRNSLTEILQIRGIPTLILIEKNNDGIYMIKTN